MLLIGNGFGALMCQFPESQCIVRFTILITLYRQLYRISPDTAAQDALHTGQSHTIVHLLLDFEHGRQ